jgi:uncharacterized protein YraI
VRVAVPVTTAAAISVGAVTGLHVLPRSGEDPRDAADRLVPEQAAPDAAAGVDRGQPVSRAGQRVTLTARPPSAHGDRPERATTPPTVLGYRWTTAPLNVWTGPGEDTTFLRVLPWGSRVAVTGRVQEAWAEVVERGRARWVRAAYLSPTRPEPTPTPSGTEHSAPAPTPRDSARPSPSPARTRSPSEPAKPRTSEPRTSEPRTSEPTTSAPTTPTTTDGTGFSHAPCPDGSAVERGLVDHAVSVYRAVCARFPALTTYGGYRNDGSEHSDGTSVDMMVYSDSSLGDRIASWLRSNARALHVREVIWAQHIWTVERSSEGWRPMEDRGSVTANHYDHVHVRVY